MRRFHFALLALALLAVQPLVAGTYYVGNETCHSTSPYTTISAAVAAVPSGSTIDVCPGTYAEQVVIPKALTLQAIPNWNTGPVVISDVGVSLVTATSIYWGTVAPQVQVTAENVNITNINVFENNPSGCPATEIAIFYGSGSSGTVKGAVTNGNCQFGSIGVEAENGAGAAQSVTVEYSQINAGSIAGIAVGSSQVPTSSLTAVVSNNYVWTSPVGIMSLGNAHGSISDNFIASYPSGGTGVWAGSCCVPVSENWIEAQNIGIDIEGTIVSVTSNRIFASSTTGINIGVGGVTVKRNGITYTTGTAVELNCTTGNTVFGNIINNANVGLGEIPSGFTGANYFFNVATDTTACAANAGGVNSKRRESE